jgi:hypothetical protein
MNGQDIGILVGVVSGIAGTVLGILNTVVSFNRSRVKLTAIPKRAYCCGTGYIVSSIADAIDKKQMASGVPWRWCIEVTNLSAFPITVSEVGFGRASNSSSRLVIAKPEIGGKRDFPTRLEPRESATFYAGIGVGVSVKYPWAFVKTACGTLRHGTSPIFRKYCKGSA